MKMMPTSPANRPFERQGFTLIELLVVIAIVAVLVGLLLPTLRKARMEAWKAVSLSNVRSIAQAGTAYQNENKGYLPITPFGSPIPASFQESSGFCTWTGWGNDCSITWYYMPHSFAGNTHDVTAAARPLNPYLTSESIPDTRVVDSHNPTELASRGKFKLEVCRDPSDKIGHQQDWNNPGRSYWTPIALPNVDGSSCYEDVGTSYLWQSKWFFQSVYSIPGGDWKKAFRLGTERLRLADAFQPSRMIWLNDEYCDITINRQDTNAQVINGYGDVNRSVVGFLDGHVRYQKIIPGGDTNLLALTQPWKVPAYNNKDYTVIFADLKAR